MATDDPPPRSGRAAEGSLGRGHVPGEAGVWVLIFGDMMVFAILFGTFVYYRGHQPALFRHSQHELHRYFGAINTLLLLTSSVCVITAVRAIRAELHRLASVLIVVAMICGGIFLIDKGLEWTSLISAGDHPSRNNFFMLFFLLTAIHAVHLTVGMGVLTVMLVLSRKEELTPGQYMFIEGGACFWHMVDLLWIVLFALLYLMH